MTDRITKKHASGVDISRIIHKMEPAIENEERHLVLIACLSIACLVMDPDLTPEQLTDGVAGASEWMSLYLANRNEDGVVPLSQLN